MSLRTVLPGSKGLGDLHHGKMIFYRPGHSERCLLISNGRVDIRYYVIN